MPLPKGYTLDQPQPKLPPGYTLDTPSSPTPGVDTVDGVKLPGFAAAPTPVMRGGAGNLETIPSSESEPGFAGAIKTGVHNFGARVANNAISLAKPLAHIPSQIASYNGIEAIKNAGNSGPIQDITGNPDKGVGFANAAGDIATAGLFGKAAQGVAEGISSVAPKIVPAIGRTGESIQQLGAGVINSKFAPTMKEVVRGNNPGRGMLESGIGTTLTKENLANKVSGATDAVGSRIGEAVTRADQNALAPPILSKDLAPAITSPIDTAVGKLNGPFGTASTAPYEAMTSKLGNTAPGAKAPIYGPNAPAEIAPTDLWKHIQNLDQNTRFNTDPEVESVNETRRDIRQGLRPYLEASDPTIRPLSRTYSDLLAGNDAIARSQGGFSVPKGVSSLLDSTIKSTPVVTGTGSGLFKVGGALKNFSTNAPEWMGGSGGAPATIGFQPKPTVPMQSPALLNSANIASPGGADYSSGGFPNNPSVVTPQPASPLRLPSAATNGEVQPMIGIKNDYPELATPFARERTPATLFAKPEVIPSRLFTAGENGELRTNRPRLPAPPKILKRK